MSKDLFVLDVLARCFADEHPQAALERALTEIEQLGRRTTFQLAFAQARHLMTEVRAQLAIEFVIEREGTELGAITGSGPGRVAAVSGVTPGPHLIKLSTGRVVWDGILTEADLIWAAAFPGQDLALAADTGGGARRTRQEPLLDGRALLYVCPGIESGQIGVELR